jgi:putative transposase
MFVRKAYKVRLYPNKHQEDHLLNILGSCRWVYNYYLEKKITYYKQTGKTLSYSEMSRDLTQLRHNTEWLSHNQLAPLGSSLRRLEIAYRRFFSKKSKYPKFKSKKQSKQSFQKAKDWRLIGNKIQIQSDLVVRFRGNVGNGELRTLTVSRYSTGDWFATILVNEYISIPLEYSKAVGIDIGIATLATLSDGTKFPNIQPQKSLQNKLEKAQRALARKKIGSKRRDKARVEVAKIYQKIKNVRENHLHQVSHAITSKNHALIAVEDLNVKGMLKNRKLSRALVDVSFNEFLRQVKYKQEWCGGQFVKIGRFVPSSKTCSLCGIILKTLPLSVRNWTCESCGTEHDRDINAAKVILKEAVAYTEHRD